MSTEPTNLTPKQAAFVAEYLVDLNATQAAIRAGYSEATAHSIGHENLSKPEIADAIAAAQLARSERTRVTQDYVLENTREVLERCMQRAPVMVRRGRVLVQATDEDDNHVWQFDARGAMGALTLLAKHVGGFVDRHVHAGDPDGQPIAHSVHVTHTVIDAADEAH